MLSKDLQHESFHVSGLFGTEEVDPDTWILWIVVNIINLSWSNCDASSSRRTM